MTSTLHPSPAAGSAGPEGADSQVAAPEPGNAAPSDAGPGFDAGSGMAGAGPLGVSAVTVVGDPGLAYAYAPPGRIVSFVQRVGQRMPEWMAPAGVAMCAVVGVAYTLFMDPTAADAESRPTCIMKLLTGFDCPGCGGTRAAWYMLHGDLGAAARHHAPLVFATPFVIYIYLAWTLGLVTKRKLLPQLRLPNTVLAGFIGAWIMFSIVRNLPWAPFTWLYV